VDGHDDGGVFECEDHANANAVDDADVTGSPERVAIGEIRLKDDRRDICSGQPEVTHPIASVPGELHAATLCAVHLP